MAVRPRRFFPEGDFRRLEDPVSPAGTRAGLAGLTTPDESLEITPRSDDAAEEVALMAMDSSTDVDGAGENNTTPIARLRSGDMVALAAAKLYMYKQKREPVPEWFEGQPFVALNRPFVRPAVILLMLFGGAQPTTSLLIRAACGVAVSKPAALAALGLAIYWGVLSYAMVVVMPERWRPRSRGGGTLTELMPAGTTVQTNTHLWMCKYAIGWAVAVTASVVCWSVTLILAMVPVVFDLDSRPWTRDFDTEDSSVSGMLQRHGQEFLLPPPECATRSTQVLLATWALWGYIPALQVMVMYLQATWMCVILMCGLGEDAIDAVSHNVSLRAASLNDAAWEARVKDPMVELARSTIPSLTKVGEPIAGLGVALTALSFSQIPMAVATGNHHHALLVTYGLVPIVLALPLAAIGSSCDDLLDRLNELNVEGDGAVANRRVMPLQRYLANLNRRQGLGVRLNGMVIDKAKLQQIASAVFTVGSTLVISLAHFGQESATASSEAL